MYRLFVYVFRHLAPGGGLRQDRLRRRQLRRQMVDLPIYTSADVSLHLPLCFNKVAFFVTCLFLEPLSCLSLSW